MSWELTRFVLDLQNLTPTEKAVAHCLACHAPKHGTAYPSMETIAREAGVRRRGAQKIVRRLEAKGVISPTTLKKGGRKNPTHYQFNLGNSEPPFALYGPGKGEHRDPNSGERANGETLKGEPPFARDSSRQKAVDSTSAATAAISQEQMEKELQIVWNYYLDAFDKPEEIISPSLRKIGLAILSGMLRGANRVEAMAAVIDMAHYIVKHDSRKPYFAEWPKIFGKFSTFRSLHEQWRNSDVPDAAELPEEFLSPKTTSPSTA